MMIKASININVTMEPPVQ